MENSKGEVPPLSPALSVFYHLANEEAREPCDVYPEERSTDNLERMRHRIDLLPVESCSDWHTIRREIYYASFIGAWDRALRLFERADSLKMVDEIELRALRGPFRFLIVFSRQPRDDDFTEFGQLEWNRRKYGDLWAPRDAEVGVREHRSTILPNFSARPHQTDRPPMR